MRAAGWKLFLLAPRMLLYRHRGQHRVPPEELSKRVRLLADRRWDELLADAAAAAVADPVCPRRAACESQGPTDELAQRRAERAAALAHMGELSAARSALTAAPLAPLTTDRLNALRDPTKQPQERQVALPAWLAEYAPEEGPVAMDSERFCTNVRSARRGAAAGPSGCTSEHLRVLLDDEECVELMVTAAGKLVAGLVPSEVVDGLRLGRMVALTKPNGGIRALVMGDVFRRLVSRTLAQQFAGAFQSACAPFQYALSTRAGTEALSRALRLTTELQPRATVLSVDGVGAYDHISRAAMFEGLRGDGGLRALIPFVRMFYGVQSTYMFYDANGRGHDVIQAEGGEQQEVKHPSA